MAAEPTSPAQPPQLPTAGSLAGILDVLETDDDFRALIAGEIEEPESDIDPSITVGVPDGLRPALAAGAAGKQRRARRRLQPRSGGSRGVHPFLV